MWRDTQLITSHINGKTYVRLFISLLLGSSNQKLYLYSLSSMITD